MQSLDKMVRQLPPQLQQEATDFVEFLLEKRKLKGKKAMKLSWAGALKQYRNQYTSLGLQKKALEWWGD